MSTVRKKLVFVGDFECGKTCLLVIFCKDYFPRDTEPTVFANYLTDIEVEGKQVQLVYPLLRRIPWPTVGTTINYARVCFLVISLS